MDDVTHKAFKEKLLSVVSSDSIIRLIVEMLEAEFTSKFGTLTPDWRTRNYGTELWKSIVFGRAKDLDDATPTKQVDLKELVEGKELRMEFRELMKPYDEEDGWMMI